MFNADHYVPILRGKQAEFWALGEVIDSVNNSLTPFIELPPIAWDPDEGDAGPGTPDPSIVGVAGRIERSWGPDRPFFLELGLLPSSLAVGGGRHPVEVVFHEVRNLHLKAIPVTSPSRDGDFQDAIQSVVAQDQCGVCVRLDSEDFDDVEAAIKESTDLLEHLGVGVEDADLVLDFGEVASDQTAPMTLAAVAIINSIPQIGDWRTLTWAGTAFPSVKDYSPQTTNTAPRGEWAIWQGLRARAKSLSRTPSFADYTISGIQSDYDVSAAYYRSSPNLRYTVEADFLVWKGRHPTRYGHEQFYDICRSAIARPEFKGADFSAGDSYVARCASEEDGPGNATKCSWS